MAEAKGFIRPLITVILIGGSVLGLINVYGDNSEVLSQAKLLACGGKECSTQLTQFDRTPIAQTYHLVAQEDAKRHLNVTHVIKCQRAQILLGTWQCIDQK
jgi:hypothetical protein